VKRLIITHNTIHSEFHFETSFAYVAVVVRFHHFEVESKL